MAVVRKVQSKITLAPKGDQHVEKKETKNPKDSEVKAVESERKDEGIREAVTKKVCYFCKNKTKPSYTDGATLRRHLNDRGRIYPRGRHGTCAKHQRRVSCEIKRARHLALLPFVVRAY